MALRRAREQGLSQANKEIAAAISIKVAEIIATPGGQESLQNDPVTGLPSYAPSPTDRSPIVDGEPLGTEVRRRRHMRYLSYHLLASFFVDGPADVPLDWNFS